MTDLPCIALSIRQPWAWAIVAGHKDIENRSAFAVNKGDMEPKHICVHASKGMTQDEYWKTRDFMRGLGVTCPAPDALLRGGIIGVCTVIDVVKKHESPWFFGPRGLVLTNQREIEPIPANGALGYFSWQESGSFDDPKPWMTIGAKRLDRLEETRGQPDDLPLFPEIRENNEEYE